MNMITQKTSVILLAALFFAVNAFSVEPYTRSTYHCISIYWSTSNAGACKVDYRPTGTANWFPGQDLGYDSYSTTPLKNQYRGSLLNLNPGTKYDVRLTAGSQTKLLTASTWTENYKIKKTIKVGNLTKTYSTPEGGSAAEGYVVYDGTGSTIDTNFHSQHGIIANKSYVILRGFKIKNVSSHAILVPGLKLHDVVIEKCEITSWGDLELEPDNSGIKFPANSKISNSSGAVMVFPGNTRVTIQRCDIHTPRYTAAYWHQYSWENGHPHGARGIRIGNSDNILPWEANHVIRYNNIHTDPDHLFEDIIGGYPNFSKTGPPGADSDVYCNFIQGCTDDIIEADGGGQNVRYWGNYLAGGHTVLSYQSCTVGPVYFFRNVISQGESFRKAGARSGNAFKFSGNNPVYGKKGHGDARFWGPVYVYHNTALRPDASGFPMMWDVHLYDDIRNVVSRNNIFMTSYAYATSRKSQNGSTPARFVNCSFDYDLHNMPSYFRDDQPAGYDKHGFQAKATWRAGHGSPTLLNGKYQIAKGSKGYNGGVYLPNINLGNAEEGHAPDMGAQEYDSSDMVFGPNANWKALNLVTQPPVKPTLPAAPTGLSATAVSDTQINLSWSDNADNETGYKIERKTGSGGTFAQIATVTADVSTFSNTGLTANTQYTYRIRAVNEVGNSAYSNTSSATTTATVSTKPAAPTGLSLTVVSSTQLNLTWSDHSNNETKFKIERKTGTAGTYAQIATVGANVNTFNNTGLIANTLYSYRVRASNGSGNSGYSNEASAETPSLKPVAPSGLTANAVSSSQINLAWNDNATNEGNYKIERKKGSNGTFAQIATVGANVKNYKNTGLASGADYYYRVRASNSAGNSIYSNTAHASTLSKAPVVQVQTAAAITGDVNSVIQYQIEASNSPISYDASGLPAGLSIDTGSGLISGTVKTVGIYPITVSASNEFGTGTDIVSIVIESASMGVPTNLAAQVSNASVLLAWSDNSSDESNFRLRRKVGANGDWTYISLIRDVTSYTDTDVQSGITYFYKVRVAKGFGENAIFSDWSDETSVTLP